MEAIYKKIIGVAIVLFCSFAANAQKFNYTHNGVTITYEILSIPKHEVKVKYVPKNVTAVTIPAVVHFNEEAFKVTEIGDGSCTGGGGLFSSCDDYYSFKNCKLLKSVVLPNTIRKIGKESFEDCVWLRSINLPSGLKKIGNEAFRGCESLNLSSLTLPSSLKSLGDNERWGWGVNGNIFNGCSGTLYIPATIDTIGYEAFTGCNFRLSEQIGTVLDNIIIMQEGFEIAGDYGEKYKKGKKIIDSEAFGYKVVSMDVFAENVVESPRLYLKITKGTRLESNVKKILVNRGNYEIILEFYPNDTEVLELQKKVEKEARIEESKRYARQGDVFFNAGIYEDAKEQYEMAAKLNPKDMSLRIKLNNVDEAIAEQERLRKEAEERARRAEEESQIRTFVGLRSSAAKKAISRGHLQLAINELQQALDTAEAHNYDYRKVELTQRIDSIRRVQAQITDKSNVFDYKAFRPDLYELTNRTLSLRIKSFMTERDKPIERNHISFALNSGNQPGTFQLTESSKQLKKFCNEVLATERLQTLVIDGQTLKGQATFNYDIEYARGTLKVKLKENNMSAIIKYEISPQLESSLKQTIHTRIGDLPSSCNGNYTFDATSLDINGQIEHSFKLKKVHCFNGPQNAWRSLLVPGWGDKYVEDDGKFDWWKTVFSYGLIGIGIPYILDDGMIAITSSSPRQDPNINPVYPYYVFDENGYRIYDTINVIPKRNVGYIFAACGAAMWVYDVIHVYLKGSKNKRENKEHLERLSFAYDPKHDAPLLVYSLRF